MYAVVMKFTITSPASEFRFRRWRCGGVGAGVVLTFLCQTRIKIIRLIIKIRMTYAFVNTSLWLRVRLLHGAPPDFLFFIHCHHRLFLYLFHTYIRFTDNHKYAYAEWMNDVHLPKVTEHYPLA